MECRSARWTATGVVLLCGIVVAWPAQAQDATRDLAPGVLRRIPADPQTEETYTGPIPLVEITTRPQLDWTPPFAAKSETLAELAKLTVLRREIWNLEFSFKPVRHIEVDVPQASGKMQRKLIWYLVYRVRYIGNNLSPDPQVDKWDHTLFDTKATEFVKGQYFFPQFVLVAEEFNKSYQDRVIPAAIGPISSRERPDGPLLNSITISQQPVPLSQDRMSRGVWGVATWEDVDPRVDFFSIYIKGLTNAYKPVDIPDGYKPDDPPGSGRQYLTKTLRLFFWRPGDTERETDDDVQFGVPVEEDAERQRDILAIFGLRERLDYEWVYR